MRMLLIPLGTTQVCSLPVKEKLTKTCPKLFSEKNENAKAATSTPPLKKGVLWLMLLSCLKAKRRIQNY